MYLVLIYLLFCFCLQDIDITALITNINYLQNKRNKASSTYKEINMKYTYKI